MNVAENVASVRIYKRFHFMCSLMMLTIGIIFTFGGVSVSAAVESSEKSDQQKVVRVAYVISKDFQEGEEGERKSGYGYEYLQKIAYYTGWTYEYVYGSFQESLERLIAGEVDLMSNISYLEARAKLINYSDEEQGDEGFYVFGSQGQIETDEINWLKLQPIKIGVNAGRYSVDLAKKWCEEKDITYDLKEYTDMTECSDDLESGALDVIIASEVYANDGWIALEELEKKPYYYGVAKGREDLLEELNQAMAMIKTISPFYNNELRGKYIISPSTDMIRLTSEEKDWLLKKGQIVIGYLNHYMPYCATDKDSGDMNGVLADVLSYIKENYGIDYRTIAFDSYEQLETALKNGMIDVIFPFYGDYSLAEDQNMMITDAVTHSTMMVFHSGDTFDDSETIAITENDPFQKQYATIYYPDADQVYFDTIDDCMDAVLSGLVNFTIAETAKVNDLDEIKYINHIQKADLQEFVYINFAVRKGDTDLLSILNKGIQGLPTSLITNSLVLHSQKEIEYTVFDFLQEHALAVYLVMIVIFGLIIINVITYFAFKLHSQKKILEAEGDAKVAQWKAHHDPLTGLLNYTAFQELTEKLSLSENPMALIMLDIDNFKQVNDIYGHEIGNQVLLKVGNLLNDYFSKEDYVIRFARDEFLILMEHVTAMESGDVISRINTINLELKYPQDALPSISISAGIAFSQEGYQEHLFTQADQALYRMKKKGGCGCYSFEALWKEWNNKIITISR
jgi:diguanylate cyclase (GGDEF)-like protein